MFKKLPVALTHTKKKKSEKRHQKNQKIGSEECRNR